MKRTLSLVLLALLLVGMFSACRDAPGASSETSSGALKAAILLPGPISDIGWSGPAYQGLVRLRDELGFEISFNEQIAASDYENVFRAYAQAGYDIIFGHGNQFYETAAITAEEFPDTFFAITSGFMTNDKNICGINLSSRDVGFLVGALMGMMTENNQLGSVAGSEIPPLMGIVQGVEVGAKFVNPDAALHNVFIGGADAATAKEAGLALVDMGCDILTTCADVGSIGVINAATERGLFLVATAQDFAKQAPQTVLASVMTDITQTIFAIGEMYYAGTLEPRVYNFGIREYAVTMTGYGELEDDIPQEVKDKMQQIIDEIHSETLIVADLFD